MASRTKGRAARKVAAKRGAKSSTQSKSSVVKISLPPLSEKPLQKWTSIFEKSKALKAVPYQMSREYEPETAIQHKVLGWGYILTKQDDRLEVLFQDGVRRLISNYKG